MSEDERMTVRPCLCCHIGVLVPVDRPIGYCDTCRDSRTEDAESLTAEITANAQRMVKANEVLVVQGNDGNWNHDEYMRGMFNGMELICAILEEREPQFRTALEAFRA